MALYEIAILTLAAAAAGGHASSRLAQRVSGRSVRIAIVLIGVSMAVWLTVNALRIR